MRFFHIDHIDRKKCTACEECVHVCANKCFEMTEVDGKVVAKFVNADKCDFCGKCLIVCEDKAICLNEVADIEYAKLEREHSCQACENCVKICHGKSYEIVEEDGKIFAKKISNREDNSCFFSCPNQAIIYVEKKAHLRK